MAQTTLSRTLRDGSLAISDGAGTPQTMTVQWAAGDFKWTVTKNFVQVLDRGVLQDVRSGDQEACTFSFTGRMTNLYGSAGSDPEQLYEMLTHRASLGLTSTASSGWPLALQLVFTIANKASAADETVTFAKCYFTSVEPSEADPNVIAVSGFSFEEEPAIA